MSDKAILSNGKVLSISEGVNVLGLMSGTSLDGLDLCLANFKFNDGKWSYRIVKAEDETYPAELTRMLDNAQSLSAEEYARLDSYYGSYLGSRVKAFVERNGLQGKVDAVASHGQTIFHQPGAIAGGAAKSSALVEPENILSHCWTGQIGCGAGIAAQSGIDTICDFRTTDLAFGGQGAPLVPVGDRNLFAEYDFCLNIGGFSNISFDTGSSRTAFDISPVNFVLNHYMKTVGEAYDKDGQTARSGKVDAALLSALNSLDYYSKPAPKSLGREWVEMNIFPLLDGCGLEFNDMLATYTEHAAYQVARVVQSVSGEKMVKMLVTGGGAFNKYLVERMGALCPSCDFVVPDSLTVCFKEALIFAFLGTLWLFNIPSCLASVTGASKSNIGGAMYKAGI